MPVNLQDGCYELAAPGRWESKIQPQQIFTLSQIAAGQALTFHVVSCCIMWHSSGRGKCAVKQVLPLWYNHIDT